MIVRITLALFCSRVARRVIAPQLLTVLQRRLSVCAIGWLGLTKFAGRAWRSVATKLQRWQSLARKNKGPYICAPTSDKYNLRLQRKVARNV